MDDGARLEHPLPAGMRDLLPPDAAARRVLARAVLERLTTFGYRLVTPPAFELADVIERGLGRRAAADVLRFVEPETGEVCVLRPDMTPPIARIVATRLASRPPPYRIAYEGTVVRRLVGRAKKHREMAQVGVELCGLAGQGADLELLELAASSLRGAGLERFTIDLADAGIVRALLEGVPEARAEVVTAALAKKDEAALASEGKGLPHADALAVLTRLHGGRDALVEGVALLAKTPAADASKRLLALFDAACARGLGDVLAADAGEVRGFAYYTGLIFTIYAPGPGEPVGAGGRYDELLARFGAPMPAVGFGIDLDALARALVEVGAPAAHAEGVVIVGAPDDARIGAVRARGHAAVAAPDRATAIAYAEAWNYRLVWDGDEVIAATGGALGKEAFADKSVDAVLRDKSVDAVLRVLETNGRGR